MPLVFVHGVNNRKEDPGYDVRIGLTQRFFDQHLAGVLIGGKPLGSTTATFPYWGDLATQFPWDMAGIPPMDGNQALGSVQPDMRVIVAMLHDRLGDLASGQDQPLATLAKRSLPDAVALITDLLLLETAAQDADVTAAFIAEAQSYAEAHPYPVWLPSVTTDQQFIGQLIASVKASGSGGLDALGSPFAKIGNWIGAGAAKLKGEVKKAVGTVVDRVGDYASTQTLAWARRPLNATLGRFFGDVFAYLDHRGTRQSPGPIPQRILASLDAARAAAPGEPLVIVGHSLGGVITFDLFSHFRPDVQVDLFVSVGSQISHFEEMKRFRTSDPTIPSTAVPRAPCPANIKRWLNIFDPVDIFSYACRPVFDNVIDYAYDTRTYTIKAHGAYFDQKRLYERLRERINQLP
ncbi:MAG TPA: alpha/beta fold hydrolase [Longimicrobium sp.]|jgi:hypothetical protein|uniref:alpha/beta fold hydrolase n=1 Tax=Longimicrobium sp. TaxID=2029185 RepID=UPI002EDA81F3